MKSNFYVSKNLFAKLYVKHLLKGKEHNENYYKVERLQ